MPMEFKGSLLDIINHTFWIKLPHVSCVFQVEVFLTVENPVKKCWRGELKDDFISQVFYLF